jgi:hypothetical protein
MVAGVILGFTLILVSQAANFVKVGSVTFASCRCWSRPVLTANESLILGFGGFFLFHGEELKLIGCMFRL